MIDQTLTPFAIAFIVFATVASVVAVVVIVDVLLEVFRPARSVAPLGHLRPAAPTVSRSAA